MISRGVGPPQNRKLTSLEDVKWTKVNGMAAAALVVIVGALLAARHAHDHSERALPGPPHRAEGAGTNQIAVLKEAARQLETERARLAASLAAANAENVRLEKAKEQADHSARLFRELAEESRAQDQNPTNTYPTPRHLLAGVGKQMRLAAEIEAKWGNVDEEKLPPEERQAVVQAGICIASEIVRVQQAAEQMGIGQEEGSLDHVTPEGMADYVSCYLHGALELDSAQFSSINGVLQKYCQQAVDEHLLDAKPGEAEDAMSERIAALDLLNENARAEIQSLLSEKQAAMLSHAAFRDFKFVTARFSLPGGFDLKVNVRQN